MQGHRFFGRTGELDAEGADPVRSGPHRDGHDLGLRGVVEGMRPWGEEGIAGGQLVDADVDSTSVAETVTVGGVGLSGETGEPLNEIGWGS